MIRGGIILVSIVTVCAAGAADCAAPERYGGEPGSVGSPPDDGSVWLSWDNGTASPTNRTFSSWVGHEFDVSTLENYNYLRKFRMYMRAWPNRRWDGGRIGIWSFQGGVPGSLLWGPTFVMPRQEGWNDFEADCFLGSRRKFLAGWDQFYNYPNGDTLCFDTGPARAVKWLYYGGTWGPLEGPDANLMLRVQVDDEHNPGVAPASLGRVKALYR